MGVNVRRALAGDSAVLASLAAATFPLACPPHTTDEAKADFISRQLSEERFAEYVADPARAVFIAETENGERVPVGYTMIVEGAPADPDVAAVVVAHPVAELSKCYVHPDHHGAGVAAKLLTTSLDYARMRGAEAVWLGVNEENERAHRFYAKHGFRVVGRKRFLVGDRLEDDDVMLHVFSALG